MKKEIICLNIGQAGIQISNAQWELFCIEHGIHVDGFQRNPTYTSPPDNHNDGLFTFFQETSIGRLVPRCINIDMEPTVIDEIRTGPYRQMWHPDCLISGFEDAANNYARGHNMGANRMLPGFFRQLLRLVRDSHRTLHGFIINQSMGGGTGSGLFTALLEKIDREFSKYTKLVCTVCPGPVLSTAVVEPYNAVLCTSSSIELTDLVILNDNESLYDICVNKLFINSPTYANLNRIISHLFCSLTVSFRYTSNSTLDHDLAHLQTNLVPYPRIHFPFANYAPLNSQNVLDHSSLTVQSLANELFDSSNQLLQCNVELGKYMSSCIQFRGMVSPREINEALNEVKTRKDVQFVEWCPTGFKVGLSHMPPGFVSNSFLAPTVRNAAMFTNSTAVEQAWKRLHQKFDLLYNKQAFIHWFVSEGMEEAELTEGREEIIKIQSDYQSLNEDSSKGDETTNNSAYLSNNNDYEKYKEKNTNFNYDTESNTIEQKLINYESTFTNSVNSIVV